MTTTASRVADRIQEDIVLQEALARGIVNFRAAARWLLEANDWEGSEDAVISALRRYGPEEVGDAFEPARDALGRSHLNTRSRMCSLHVRNDIHVRESLPSLFQAIDYAQGETLRFLSSDRGFVVIADERNLDRVVDILGEENVSRVQKGLTELSVMIPPESWETPGILALLSSRLAMKGINIAGIVDGVFQEVFLVDDDDAFQAYDALVALTKDPENGSD